MSRQGSMIKYCASSEASDPVLLMSASMRGHSTSAWRECLVNGMVNAYLMNPYLSRINLAIRETRGIYVAAVGLIHSLHRHQGNGSILMGLLSILKKEKQKRRELRLLFV